VLAHEQGERGHEAQALRVLGDIEAHRDPADPAAATAWFVQASELAESLGMRPLVARCQLGLARIARRSSDRRAPELLAEARSTLRTMAMGVWLGEAETEYATVGGTRAH
jgi:hypothetical protein